MFKGESFESLSNLRQIICRSSVGCTRPPLQLLHRNVQRFRGGLVFKAHSHLYHSTLGLRVIKKKKRPLSHGTANLPEAALERSSPKSQQTTYRHLKVNKQLTGIWKLQASGSQQTTYRHLEDNEGEGGEHDEHSDDRREVEVRRAHHLVMSPVIQPRPRALALALSLPLSHSHTHTITLTLSHSHTLTHSHTHSLSVSLSHKLSRSHTHTLSLSRERTTCREEARRGGG